MTLSPGLLLGPYEIVGHLGSGGMGEVYSALDTRLDRTVAIKILPDHHAGDADRQRRFALEAKAAAALNHPNICTLHEIGEHEDQAYIVMECIDGHTIEKLIPAGGLATETVLRYGIQIADALAYAHEHGVVHRDLKSTNVMVTSDGNAKVVDFGLAKRSYQEDLASGQTSLETLTSQGSVVGTLAYVAPETLTGQPVDARCDIWALGVLLHQMASRELPFRGRTGYELSASILHEPPAPLRDQVPPGLRAVIRNCLAKETRDRYQSAGEVRAALESTWEDLTLWQASNRSMNVADPLPAAAPAQDSREGSAPGSAESFLSGSTAEIQTLNRIDRTLQPIMVTAKVLGTLIVGALVLGLLGFITGVTFDLALHVPSQESLLDYVVLGLRAMIPAAVWMVLDILVLALLMTVAKGAGWIVHRFRHRDVSESSPGILRRAEVRLQSVDPNVLARSLLAASLAALVAIVAFNWKLFAAIEQLIERPNNTLVDTSILSPAAEGYQFLSYWVAATLTLVLSAGWMLFITKIKQPPDSDSSIQVPRAAGVSIVILAAVLTVAPWRLLWNNEREPVHYQGQKSFIVSETEDRLFLYVPTGPVRHREVGTDDPGIERVSGTSRENIFATE